MVEDLSNMHEVLGLISNTTNEIKFKDYQLDMVAHAFKPSTRVAEAGESLSSGLHREALS